MPPLMEVEWAALCATDIHDGLIRYDLEPLDGCDPAKARYQWI